MGPTGLDKIAQKMILFSFKAQQILFQVEFLHIQLRSSTLVSRIAISLRSTSVVAGSARSDWLTLEFSDDSTTMIVWLTMVNLLVLDRHSPFNMLTASLTPSLLLQSLASDFRNILVLYFM